MILRFATRPVAVALFAALSSVPDEIHRDPGTDIEAYATTLAELFDAAVKA